MISVIIPTLNEEKQIGNILDFLKSKNLVSEIIVIDDGSVDETFKIAKSRGAKVFLSSMLGKGASMADGLSRAQNEHILFLDGDIFNFSDDLVEKMIFPLIHNEADFVKGRFFRSAGRVTALTARPLIKTFFPDLIKFKEPLGGIVAGNKEFLQRVHFENDYGVDIGLLIDIHQFGARIVEADIGSLDHDHQSLDELSQMSFQIVRTILDRASKYQKLHYASLKDSSERERVNCVQFDAVLSKIKPEKKLILFDMDGTIIEGRFIEYITNIAGKRQELEGLLGNHHLDPFYRNKMIAKTLTGIPKYLFEKVARTIPLKPKAQETIVELKKRDYQIGIITDSYFIASEVIKKRVFADFSIANLLHFNRGLASGDILLSPFMQIDDGCKEHQICKSNFLNHLQKNLIHSVPEIISFGNGENDVCLFKKSNKSFAVYPESAYVAHAAKNNLKSLSEALNYL